MAQNSTLRVTADVHGNIEETKCFDTSNATYAVVDRSKKKGIWNDAGSRNSRANNEMQDKIVRFCDEEPIFNSKAVEPVSIQGNKSPEIEENFYEEIPQCFQYDEEAEKRKLCPPAQYSLEVLKNLPVRPRKSKIKYLDNFHIFDPATDFIDDKRQHQNTAPSPSNVFNCCFIGKN